MKQESVMVPVDVVIKIAFAIPDAKDLFAFLEALRLCIDLGPLEHLYQLCLKQDHFDVWPALKLTSAARDKLSLPHYESIAKYYSRVIVNDARFSVEWLRTHLNSMATIEWNAGEIPVTEENLDEWQDLRITGLNVYIDEDTPRTWKNVLSRLHCLTSLRVYDYQVLWGNDGDFEEVYAYAAYSNQLVELVVYTNSGYTLQHSELVYLLEWFRRQPVQEFESDFTDWGYHDFDLRQALCEAMFNCPTMERLRLIDCYLFDMVFPRFTFQMESLKLDEWCLDSDFLIDLAGQLEGSRLTRLELDDCTHDGNIEGIECLLRVLPLTSTKSLSILGLQIDCDDWCQLAPLIQYSGLESLTLNPEHVSTEFAQSLATALQNNHTIGEFHLSQSWIAIPDLQLLIEAMSHPSRQVKSKRVKLTTANLSMMKESTLKPLEELATQRGCEFVHDCVGE